MKILRRIRYVRVLGIIAIMSSALYITSSLLLQSYNNDLSMQIQSIKNDITTIQETNDALKINIQSLSSNNRVQEIANDAGLSLNQNNIISISK